MCFTCRTKGHADIEVGWPELKTIEDLIDILATIAWTASAHHAAVNFGQADYSSMPLNRSALFRKPLPEEGTEDYEVCSPPIPPPPPLCACAPRHGPHTYGRGQVAGANSYNTWFRKLGMLNQWSTSRS